MNQNNCLKLAFVTTNRHKFEEVKRILSEFNIDAEWVNEDLLEPEGKLEFIAEHKAKHAAEKLKRPVAVEDTGIFFEAYNNFPGTNPKFVFNGIGFDGILRLLEGKSRKAYSKTIAAYCEPGKKPMLFEGIMKVTMADKVHNPEKDSMPYDHLFIPEGYDITISDMTLKEKNTFSQRAKAFRKLGGYLSEKKI